MEQEICASKCKSHKSRVLLIRSRMQFEKQNRVSLNVLGFRNWCNLLTIIFKNVTTTFCDIIVAYLPLNLNSNSTLLRFHLKQHTTYVLYASWCLYRRLDISYFLTAPRNAYRTLQLGPKRTVWMQTAYRSLWSSPMVPFQ